MTNDWDPQRMGSAVILGKLNPEALNPPQPLDLPLDLWPDSLRAYAAEAAAETETPPAMPAMLCLAVICTAIQGCASVSIKPGYSEPANIYTLIVMPPSSRKSPEVKRAMRPLTDWEKKQRKIANERAMQVEARRAALKRRIEAIERKMTRADDDAQANELMEQSVVLRQEMPETPTAPRLFASDVTSENLGVLMAQNSETMAVISSEGGVFENMVGRYLNGKPNIDLYQSSYTGEPVRVDRNCRESVIMDSPRLTIALAVQEAVLDNLFKDKADLRGRGLLSRFLYVIPESNVGYRTGDGEAMSAETLETFENLVDGLLENSHRADPVSLELTSEALEEWEVLREEIEFAMRKGERFAHMTDWAGKAAGGAARIAAGFHAARHGKDFALHRISATDMRAATQTVRALSEHALCAYGQMKVDPKYYQAERIVEWIKNHNRSKFTLSEFCSSTSTKNISDETLHDAVNLLQEAQFIAARPSQAGPGRPTRKYTVNPEVHEVEI